MARAKRTAVSGIITLTRSYQRRYPYVARGRIVPNKIAHAQRVEYLSKLTMLLVGNKTIARYLGSTQISIKGVRKGIVEYALKKAGGNKEQAIALLRNTENGVYKKLNSAVNRLRIIAKKRGLTGDTVEKYAKDYLHQVPEFTNAWIISRLDECITKIKRMKAQPN